MNRKDFKNLLAEWNVSFNNNILTETKAGKKYIEKVKEAINVKEDKVTIIDNYGKLYSLNPAAATDTLFLKIVVKTFEEEQGHSIEDIEGQYEDFLKYVKKNWEKDKPASVDVPGGLRTKLLPDNTTYDDLVSFCEAKRSMMLKSKTFIECLAQEDINPDFEVIINDSDWIICYPKTIRGSISLARSYWNGERLEYDTTISGGIGQNIGRMSWCTSIVSGSNMFLSYHRRANLHMYYCIKKNMSVEDPDRKLCISFVKENDNVSLSEGNKSVNGNNQPTDESKFREYIGSRFDDLTKDVEKDTRPELNEKAYSESISVDQYRILRAANEDDLGGFIQELEGILKYSRDRREIFSLVKKDMEEISIRRIVANCENLSELDPSGDTIKQLAQDPDDHIRLTIAEFHDLLKADPSGDIIRQLAQDPYEFVRSSLAMRSVLLKVDPSGDIIKQLVRDKSPHVRASLAERSDLLKVDPSGNIIKQLARDEDPYVRCAIAGNKDLLRANQVLYETDPSINLINQLAQDTHEYVKIRIAERKDLLEADPSGNIIMQLVGDTNPYVSSPILRIIKEITIENKELINILLQSDVDSVRAILAQRKDLLELDPSGNTIKQLAKDHSFRVRRAIAGCKELLKVDPSGEIIKKLAQDSHEHVRESIARRKDLLEVDPSGEIIKQLSQDEDVDVRCTIAYHKDLLKADPSGATIRRLAQDPDVDIIDAIAQRKDLLAADPSGNIIKQLIAKNYWAKSYLSRNYDLDNLSTPERTDESVLKKYIKIMLEQGNIK